MLLPVLLSLLACKKQPPVEVAVEGVAADLAAAQALAPLYDPLPAVIADCELTVDAQVGWLAQLSCPGDRVLTDMRGPGVPPPEGAMEAVMQTLAALGMQSAPRQALVDLPGGGAQAMVVDAQGGGLALTTWVVHHMGTMPQVLTCMAVQGDEGAQAWCLEAMAALLLPAGTVLPQLER